MLTGARRSSTSLRALSDLHVCARARSALAHGARTRAAKATLPLDVGHLGRWHEHGRIRVNAIRRTSRAAATRTAEATLSTVAAVAAEAIIIITLTAFSARTTVTPRTAVASSTTVTALADHDACASDLNARAPFQEERDRSSARLTTGAASAATATRSASATSAAIRVTETTCSTTAATASATTGAIAPHATDTAGLSDPVEVVEVTSGTGAYTWLASLTISTITSSCPAVLLRTTGTSASSRRAISRALAASAIVTAVITLTRAPAIAPIAAATTVLPSRSC